VSADTPPSDKQAASASVSVCACMCVTSEGQEPLAVVHDIMSRDLRPELDTMVLAAAAQKSAAM